jgi:hypothetical protein
MRATAFPTWKLLLFAFLSLADLALTLHLLGAEGSAVYERNLLAVWCLAHFGWVGLAGFKAATVSVAAGLSAAIHRRSPRAAHRVLALGCAALAAVVTYSGYLCDTVRRPPAALDPAEAAPLLAESGRLEDARQRILGYAEMKNAVVGDLCARRCSLAEGVTRLAVQGEGPDRAAFVRRVRAFAPGYSEAEYLAISLICHVMEGAAASSADQRLTADLVAEFQAVYGRAAPPWLLARAGASGGRGGKATLLQ